jgi:hypothetical protein
LEPGTPQGGQEVLELTVHATETIEVAERGRHPVVPGHAYCLKAQVRTALGNAHGRLFLQWLDAAGEALALGDAVGFGGGESDLSFFPASVSFVVEGDGKVLWKSPVTRGGTPALDVDVNTSGVKTLILRIQDAEDGTDHDHGFWANLQFENTSLNE